MKRLVLLILLVFTIVLCISCSLNNERQVYHDGFEDYEHQIVDVYGDYIIVAVHDKRSISLTFKNSYLKDEQKRTQVPEYKIIEDIRVLTNQYIDNNPHSLLADEMHHNCMSITLGQRAGDHYQIIFEVDNYFIDDMGDPGILQNQFVYYSCLSHFSSIVPEEYVSDMYDYIAITGENIRYIDMFKFPGISEDEQRAWEEEIYSKFPLVTSPEKSLVQEE